MKKIILLGLCIVNLVAFSTPLSSIEITTQLPFQESFVNSTIKVKAINDLGQLIGTYSEPKINTKFFIIDVEKGVQIVSQKNKNLNPYRINNVGQILVEGASIWSEGLGFTTIEIPDGVNLQSFELNDVGQIIGIYRQKGFTDYRPFKWDNGVAYDLGPGSDFAKGFDEIGIYPLRIEVKDINNNGELVGRVHYGKFNELTGKYVKVGCSNFFWNGSVHLIELPKDGFFDTIKLNEQSDVLLCSGSLRYKSYIWNLKSGVVSIEGLHGIDFNNDRVVIGHMQVLQEDGQLIEVPGVSIDNINYTIAELLGVEDAKRLIPPYSDNYEPESLFRIIAINNLGQIAAECTVWDDIYPCILNIQGLGK